MREDRPRSPEIVARLFADLAADGHEGLDGTGGAVAPGRVLGGYRLLRLLGRGGMAEVWEAEQPELNRRVALKLLEGRALESPARRARFLREAEAGARLRHPGIVSVFAVGEDQGTLFLAQELVPGGRTFADDLADQRRGGPPPADHYRSLAARFAAVADALAYAHAQGILHRDIKPSNLLAEPDGRMRVGDFGLARLLDQPGLSRTGDVSGTPCYMSPEQITGRPEELGPASDVFSLGVSMYEAFTLALPFDGDSSPEIFDKIRRADPADPRRRRARMPRELAWITLKALEKDRGRRYPGMPELAADLRAFLEHRAVAAGPPGPLLRAGKWARRHPVVAASASVAAAAFAVITVLLLDAQRSRDHAETEARTALRTASVLENLFLNAAPGELPSGFSAADLLRRSVAEAEALADEPAVQLRLLSTLSHVYWSMGERAEAEALAQRALDTAEREFGADGVEYAAALLDLAQAREDRASDAESLDLARRAYSGLRRLAGPEDRRTLRAGMLYGQFLTYSDQLAEARAVLESVIAAPESALPPGCAEWLGARAGLTRLLQRSGDYTAAESMSRTLIDTATRQRGADDPFTMGERAFLGQILLSMGQAAAAEQELLDCLHWNETALGPEHRATLGVLRQLGLAYDMQGRGGEAEAAYRRALEGLSRQFPPDDPAVIDLRVSLGSFYLRQEGWDQAADFVEPLPELTEARYGKDSLAASYAHVLHGWLQTGRGEYEAAALELEAALVFLHGHYGLTHRYSQTAVDLLAEACRGLGAPERVVPLLEQSLTELQAEGQDTARVEEWLAELRPAPRD